MISLEPRRADGVAHADQVSEKGEFSVPFVPG